ncbi:MAG: hypothetical protein MJY56_04985 [Bacteroidales bacterium]|nr:hypothetical protein [Bacteroidales bacterium]
MEALKVNFVEGLEALGEAALEEAFAANAVPAKVANVNWPSSYPYKPDCCFQVLRSREVLGVRFEVESLDLRATAFEDNGRSWEDSCCEFFVLGSDGKYTNVETTCIGSVLMARGAGREGREKLPMEALARVIRYSSLEHKVYDLIGGPYKWSIMVLVPFDLLGLDKDNLPATVSANFYKCADLTANPHFLSWNPVITETPDFHRPEFFGILNL